MQTKPAFNVKKWSLVVPL